MIAMLVKSLEGTTTSAAAAASNSKNCRQNEAEEQKQQPQTSRKFTRSQQRSDLLSSTSSRRPQNAVFSSTLDRPIVKMCRVETFSAAHRLHNAALPTRTNCELFGKCNSANGHGHNYMWKVVLEGPVDAQTGMVYNLADLKQHMAEVLELVDHKHLDLDVPYFRDNGIVSTTENLAVFLYNVLSTKMLSSRLLLKKVVVGETDKNSFSYSGK